MVVMAQLQNYGRWTFAKTTMGWRCWRTKASLWGRWQEWDTCTCQAIEEVVFEEQAFSISLPVHWGSHYETL